MGFCRTAVLLAVLSFPAAASAQFFNFSSPPSDSLQTPVGEAFLQAYHALESGYLTKVNANKLFEGAIQGMLQSLHDPYTSYASPEMAAQEVQDRTGSFEGIGATLRAQNQRNNTIVQVVTVYQGSPAEKAGVKPGDIFVKIDGKDVRRKTTDEIVKLVRGPAGTKVNLEMKRHGKMKPVAISVTRGSIAIVDVDSTMLPNHTGYVNIRSFANAKVFEQLDNALVGLKAQGAEALILDLRNNGGGLLTQGISVADEFLSKGDIVFQRARGVTQRIAQADPKAFTWPMVVLVNRDSASASEIVAGALQANGRAKVIGEVTFGKGVGQNVISLPNGGQLVYKSFEWLTPDRRSINKKGIKPDIEIKDATVPSVVALEGGGLEKGQTIEFMVDGKKLGVAKGDKDGRFIFVQPVEAPKESAVQGQALVDMKKDPILKAGYEELLKVQRRVAR